MKGTRFLFGFFALFLFCLPTFAAGSLKIGVIDLPRIISDSNKAKKVNVDLRKKYASRRDKILKRQKALQKKVEAFKRDAAVLKATDKRTRQREIANEQTDIQRLQQDFQQDISVDQNKAMQGFLANLRKVIEQYSKANKLDLVVQKDAIPYASKRVDITEIIIKKLNAKS